jgi:hypothetical protein
VDLTTGGGKQPQKAQKAQRQNSLRFLRILWFLQFWRSTYKIVVREKATKNQRRASRSLRQKASDLNSTPTQVLAIERALGFLNFPGIHKLNMREAW